ncbi:hypothetical protein COEREDRAFT_85567 [Coemansia reversa NRRL 1564]|uniref:Homeobox domain-containing protein n=1 Tax=Coemansia reversa (strain ATCC 12441 / NRRL 1564) TaxID=763665 RepID=A0A2G5BGF5_COERN|nr:hypothetical protein COEREDRAFT_85567 [Coemansia reversa NRRL 1564]|eukprot:PIA18106.1 hypothetical protein COEREDRAFT_85567 [Coemansia reversa NRRL 1564]
MGYSESFSQSNISHPLGSQQNFTNVDLMALLEQVFTPSIKSYADERDASILAPVLSTSPSHLAPHVAMGIPHMENNLFSSAAPTTANVNTSTSAPLLFHQSTTASSANLSIPTYTGLDTFTLQQPNRNILGLLSSALSSSNWNHILSTSNADSHRNPTRDTTHATTAGGFGGAPLSSDVVAMPESTLAGFEPLPLAYTHSSMSWDHTIVPAGNAIAQHANSHEHNHIFPICQTAQAPAQVLHVSAIEKHNKQPVIPDCLVFSGLSEPLLSSVTGLAPAIQANFPSYSNQSSVPHLHPNVEKVRDGWFSREHSSSSSITSTSQLESRLSETGGEAEDSESDIGSDASIVHRCRLKTEGNWKNQPRNSISKKQKKIFYSWLLNNTSFPFPTEDERLNTLVVDTISEKQFRYWFANIRCRQFTKRRDSKGGQFFTPNAKFYESCSRIGLQIKHSIPASIRQNMKLQRRPLKSKN